MLIYSTHCSKILFTSLVHVFFYCWNHGIMVTLDFEDYFATLIFRSVLRDTALLFFRLVLLLLKKCCIEIRAFASSYNSSSVNKTTNEELSPEDSEVRPIRDQKSEINLFKFSLYFSDSSQQTYLGELHRGR